MDIKSIFSEKCKELDKLIYIYGDDTYLAEKSLDYFLSCPEIDLIDLNYTKLSEKEFDTEKLYRIMAVPPIGSLKRLFQVELENIPVSEYEHFIELLFKIPDTSSLIITNVNNKNESKNQIVKFLLKKANCVRCSLTDNSDISELIVGLFINNGKKISGYDAIYLFNYINNDFNTLYNEVIKLCALKKDTITKEDINKYCNGAEEYKIYLLHNYLIHNDYMSAYKIYSSISNSESLISIISYLATNFEILLMASSCFDSGYSAKQTMDAIVKSFNGKYEYRIKNLISQAKLMSSDDFRNAIKELTNIDYKSKHNNYFLRESFFGELCSIYTTKKR